MGRLVAKIARTAKPVVWERRVDPRFSSSVQSIGRAQVSWHWPQGPPQFDTQASPFSQQPDGSAEQFVAVGQVGLNDGVGLLLLLRLLMRCARSFSSGARQDERKEGEQGTAYEDSG